MIEKNYVSYIQWMCKYHVAFYSIILGGGGGGTGIVGFYLYLSVQCNCENENKK